MITPPLARTFRHNSEPTHTIGSTYWLTLDELEMATPSNTEAASFQAFTQAERIQQLNDIDKVL